MKYRDYVLSALDANVAGAQETRQRTEKWFAELRNLWFALNDAMNNKDQKRVEELQQEIGLLIG